jgi:hypothetical protein
VIEGAGRNGFNLLMGNITTGEGIDDHREAQLNQVALFLMECGACPAYRCRPRNQSFRPTARTTDTAAVPRIRQGALCTNARAVRRAAGTGPSGSGQSRRADSC